MKSMRRNQMSLPTSCGEAASSPDFIGIAFDDGKVLGDSDPRT